MLQLSLCVMMMFRYHCGVENVLNQVTKHLWLI